MSSALAQYTADAVDLGTSFTSRYRIDSVIGSGGAGVVTAAYDHILKRPVAIKRLHKNSYEENTEEIDAIMNEAEVICRIQHPNIVSVFDVGVEDDAVFIVMELLNGLDFQALIGDGYLLLEQFHELAIQSLDGLVAAHALDILHLDIKPANLILVWLPSGRLHVKIVDFGMARISASSQTTKTLKLEGSIFYMSPEQFANKPLDQRSDLYSLGSVFYYALTGHLPFQGDNALQVMVSHIQHHVVPIQTLRPDLPKKICAWIDSLMQKDPEHRPSTSLDALDSYLELRGGR